MLDARCSMLDPRSSMLDPRSSMLVKDPVSSIEHRVCALVAERLQIFNSFILKIDIFMLCMFYMKPQLRKHTAYFSFIGIVSNRYLRRERSVYTFCSPTGTQKSPKLAFRAGKGCLCLL
ncbi:MAG: hypothetical protein AB1797_12635, partial [bacterium]